VTVMVTVPPDLNDEAKELLQKYRQMVDEADPRANLLRKAKA